MHEAVVAGHFEHSLSLVAAGSLGMGEQLGQGCYVLVDEDLRSAAGGNLFFGNRNLVLQLGNGVRGVGGGWRIASGRSHESLAILDHSLQGCEVAGLAVVIFLFYAFGYCCQLTQLLVAHGYVIDTEVGHQCLLQEAVARKRRAAYPAVGGGGGEGCAQHRHRRVLSYAPAVDEKLAARARLPIENVHPLALCRGRARLDSAFRTIATRRRGHALCIQAVGHVSPFRLRAGCRCGERPEEEAVAR